MIISLYLFLFLLIQLTSCEPSSTKIVASQLKSILNSYYMFAKYGKKGNLILLSTSVESEVSRQLVTLYDPKKETEGAYVPIKTNVIVPINDRISLNGDEYRESITLRTKTSTQIDNFSLIITEKNKNYFGFNSAFAFAHKIEDENYSLTHLLKRQNEIDRLKFSFQISNDKENGTLYFGGLPESIINEYSYKTVIPLSDKNSKFWEIKLDYLFIGDISYVYSNTYIQNNYKVRISTNTPKIKAPKPIVEFIVNNLFNQSLSNGVCKLVEYSYEVNCDCNDIENFSDVSFVINSKEVKFKAKELFYEERDNCIFTFIYDDKYPNEWLVGKTFLQKFIAEFDYENDEFTLYSQSQNFADVDLNTLFPSHRILKWFLIILGIIVFVVFARMGYRYYKKRKMIKMNRYIKQVYQEL